MSLARAPLEFDRRALSMCFQKRVLCVFEIIAETGETHETNAND
jgi:hypothetical protein